MLMNALMQPSLFAASSSGGTAEPGMGIVVVTGLSLVFFILLVLILIVNIEGGIFKAIEKRKAEKEKAKKDSAEPPAPVPAAPAPAPVAAAPAAPVIAPGVPPEVVAVIVAAVDASTGGAYTLQAVSVSKKGRGSWGLAGVIQSTEPF